MEVDIEIKDFEPPFLQGQTSSSADLEPVKIVAAPDGSLSRAAQSQEELVKERREMYYAQEKLLLEAIPRNLNVTWEDPMSRPQDRCLAAELRGIGIAAKDMPEWRQKSLGPTISYGMTSKNSIQDQRKSLPIFKLKEPLVKAFRESNVLVVVGETGSGKTTQMPQYLAEMGLADRGMIGITQPRRVAAISVAARVAEEYGCELGTSGKYSIRFDDCTSPETRLKFMTDGMLMREYLMDGMLRRYSVLMLDEAHERTIHTDVLFALLKTLLKKRPDLKLIVTSATLDADKFSSYFYDCPIFSIPGRTFPVEIMYVREPEHDYVDAALVTACQIHLTEPQGDILIFLTGQLENRYRMRNSLSAHEGA